jgi:hypothetical protein
MMGYDSKGILVFNLKYSIQHYVIKFVSDLRQVSGFLRIPPVSSTNKTATGQWFSPDTPVSSTNKTATSRWFSPVSSTNKTATGRWFSPDTPGFLHQ